LSFTPRKEHRLRTVENRDLRNVFAPKWVGERGSWRELQKKEIRYFLFSPNITRLIE
jgi:hypothetical protein